MAWTPPFLLSLVVAATACSGSTATSEPKASDKAAPVPNRETEHSPARKPDFVLIHYPAIGIKTFVEVYPEKKVRVVRVNRTTARRGVAAGWTLRFRSRRAVRVDQIVTELSGAKTVAESCPRRRGRDGVTWGVRNFPQGIEWGIDFEMKDGGPECSRLEAAAVDLMQYARLK